jgi:hypothetical protein
MLKTMSRWVLRYGLLFCLLACNAGCLLAADDPAPQRSSNTFFAGIVSEWTPDTTITVARTLRGRPESRTFRVTPDTKIEGTLAIKSRVTVRYVTDDDGDTATLIVVRTVRARKKRQ